MRNPKFALLLAVLAGVFTLAAAGCGKKVTSAQAVEFNNSLVSSNKRLVAAGEEFVAKASKALQGGGSVDIAIARRSYESAIETMDRVRSDVRIIAVPDSESARKYFAEFQRSLQNQDEIIRRDLGAIIKLIEDPDLTPQARGMRISVIASRLDAAANADFAELKGAQNDFARAHGIRLK